MLLEPLPTEPPPMEPLDDVWASAAPAVSARTDAAVKIRRFIPESLLGIPLHPLRNALSGQTEGDGRRSDRAMPLHRRAPNDRGRRLRPAPPHVLATIRSMSAISASGAVMLGLWVASISWHDQPGVRRASAAKGANGPSVLRVATM